MKLPENLAEPETVRQALRTWTSGVTVVTSCSEGYQHGMTVSSFTSVSLVPPILMVSLQRDSRTHLVVKQSRLFGVTILSESQQEISERFAGRTPDDEDRFHQIETFTMKTGAPFIRGGLAYLDCQVTRSLVVAGHTLFFGHVIALQVEPEGNPLLYHDRHYHFLRSD